MATAQTLSYSETQRLIASWAASGGPSDEEKDKFVDEVSEQLEDSEMVEKFLENVKAAGTAANTVDYGSDFPGFSAYNTDWKSYQSRWVKYLSESRFDQVFLDMVENIKTDQDRLDCITELKSFTNEDHDDATTTSQNLLALKRDIEDFVKRLDEFIVEAGVELEEEATKLKAAIEALQSEMEGLDKQIEDATIALSVMGGLICIIGMIAAGAMLAKYKAERADKASQLLDKQEALADVKRKQEALANLKSEFDGLKPDVALICEKLSLFAEIWAQVRSQRVQFTEQLEASYGSNTTLASCKLSHRFKKEVKLAREVCQPLEKGLTIYATELESNAKVGKAQK